MASFEDRIRSERNAALAREAAKRREEADRSDEEARRLRQRGAASAAPAQALLPELREAVDALRRSDVTWAAHTPLPNSLQRALWLKGVIKDPREWTLYQDYYGNNIRSLIRARDSRVFIEIGTGSQPQRVTIEEFAAQGLWVVLKSVSSQADVTLDVYADFYINGMLSELAKMLG